MLLIRDDGSDTLLELTLDDSSGRLRAATIVNLASAVEAEDETLWRLPRTYGVPVLAAGGFDDANVLSRADLVLPLRVAIGTTTIMATFGTEAGDKLLCVDRARFLFCRERLIGFGAEDLSADEVGMIGPQ